MSDAATEFDPLVDEQPSRFVVGIDLGTTNTAVAYIDTTASTPSLQVLSIPQLVAPGQVEARDTLPSFHCEPPAGTGAEALQMPWPKGPRDYAVGFWAREQAAQTPGRVVVSAKSWLCHSGVDRTADLLPWHAAADVQQLSPVDVSSRYLLQIRQAWNAAHPQEPLEEQDLVLTLPASFDELARELTIEAAQRAGLKRVWLIEEPQAAFYAWVDKHQSDWQQRIQPGHLILVCDIGGGTSDFTLIKATSSDRDDADIQFHRIAVGQHLILGGDNLDLALAKHLESRFSQLLDSRQWSALVNRCRQLKEDALIDNDTDAESKQLTVHLPGSSSRLIGGGLTLEIAASEIRQFLLDGFVPVVERDSKPARQQSGFREFGLPYAADAAITRHLAAFLQDHAQEQQVPGRPDVVLFNGGFFESPLLTQRVLDNLLHWFASPQHADWHPQVLDHEALHLAVAKGAAYYGMVRRGAGVRIAANLARSYYISLDDEPPTALCLVPGDAQPGESLTISEPVLDLTVSEPVEFPIFVSSVRLTDQPGQVLPLDIDQMRPLPPIRTVLKTRSKRERGSVAVQLQAELTEIGTVDLWCREFEGDRRWRLQFDVRSTTHTDIEAHAGEAETAGFVDESLWEAGQQQLNDVFSTTGKEKPARLVKQLAQCFELERHEWPPSLLRRIWEALIELESGRQKSAAHEARWLNLAGYALRPGYGLAMDDWRVSETWRLIHRRLKHSTPDNRQESLILWRRIAGGLTKGQQNTVAEKLLTQVRAFHQNHAKSVRRHTDALMKPQDSHEVWRLLASLELLPARIRIDLGKTITDLLELPKLASISDTLFWAIGRLGQRVSVYGPLNTVVPVDAIRPWITQILALPGDRPVRQLAMMQLVRRTEDRFRDVDASLRAECVRWLREYEAPEHYCELVESGGQLDSEEQNQIVGESLPKGLRLRR